MTDNSLNLILDGHPATTIKQKTSDTLNMQDMLGELTEGDVYLDEETKKMLLDIYFCNYQRNPSNE
jgi:hypothetical protein